MAGIGKVQLTNNDLRENFKVAAMMIAHANKVDIKSIDLNELVQGYVLSMIDATTNFSQLQFPITNTDLASVNNAPLIPIMKVVNQVDSFVAGKMAYYLFLYYYNTRQQQPNYTATGKMTPITFPDTYYDATVFFAGGPGYTTIDKGNILFWHGYLSIEVNGIKLYKNWECLQHLYIPYQQSAPTLFNAVSPGIDNAFALVPGAPSASPFQPNSYSAYDGGVDAFYPLEPLPVFSGSKQSIVLLNLPANIPGTIKPFTLPGYGTASANSFILKICVHLRGVLAQNSTSMK